MIWVDIKGFEGKYQVNSKGEVRSVRIWHSPRPMKAHLMKNGYWGVFLGRKGKYIHRLVAEAFISNRSNKPHVNHIDGDKQNNQPYNLEWCTHAENIAHAGRMGKMTRKSNGNARKLTHEQVSQIRQLLISKTPQRKIAQQFGVSQGTIGFIARGETWA